MSCLSEHCHKKELNREPDKKLHKKSTLFCLSLGTPKNNKFSICSKWKIDYFYMPRNLSTLQPNSNVLNIGTLEIH